jgi:hypothetical protein
MFAVSGNKSVYIFFNFSGTLLLYSQKTVIDIIVAFSILLILKMSGLYMNIDLRVVKLAFHKG